MKFIISFFHRSDSLMNRSPVELVEVQVSLIAIIWLQAYVNNSINKNIDKIMLFIFFYFSRFFAIMSFFYFFEILKNSWLPNFFQLKRENFMKFFLKEIYLKSFFFLKKFEPNRENSNFGADFGKSIEVEYWIRTIFIYF